MTQMPPPDFSAIRQGLADLPRADNHAPGGPVQPTRIVAIAGHRAALDSERALVVGNRGMGKSFWAHALADAAARKKAAATFHELASMDVLIGFNASERTDSIAPTPAAIHDALQKCKDPDAIWRAVLVRVAAHEGTSVSATRAISPVFTELVAWVQTHGESVDQLLTSLDDRLLAAGRKLVVVFDALDRLASDWETTRRLTEALLKRALAVRSYRALRLKLFMRRDQFEDPSLFAFPDGSKIRNTRVDLTWTSTDLYSLLFTRLSQGSSAKAFEGLAGQLNTAQTLQSELSEVPADRNKVLVDALAGEYMGTDKKRGRVYTWLPLHLSDSRGETSPRTFLTAWREAALHLPAPNGQAVDHLGLLEGVRRASEDRLQELNEDYWWIPTALAPLQGQMVPMDRSVLEALWLASDTATNIRATSSGRGLAPVQLDDTTKVPEAALVDALAAIGVIEIRSNGKINVPDIFRVEAGIKRKGGVRPPQRPPGERGQ